MLLRALAAVAVLAFLPLAGADSVEISSRGCVTTGVESVTPEPSCAFRCLPGDVVSVEVAGLFVSASVSCGGASAGCADTARCRAESEGTAAVEDVGRCQGVTAPTVLRCEARPR